MAASGRNPASNPPERDTSEFDYKTLLNQSEFGAILDELLTIYEKIDQLESTLPYVNKKVKEIYMNLLNRGIGAVAEERNELRNG